MSRADRTFVAVFGGILAVILLAGALLTCAPGAYHGMEPVAPDVGPIPTHGYPEGCVAVTVGPPRVTAVCGDVEEFEPPVELAAAVRKCLVDRDVPILGDARDVRYFRVDRIFVTTVYGTYVVLGYAAAGNFNSPEPADRTVEIVFLRKQAPPGLKGMGGRSTDVILRQTLAHELIHVLAQVGEHSGTMAGVFQTCSKVKA